MSQSIGITLLELLKKAAGYKGLKLVEGASKACSEPIATIALDNKLLEFLAERHIKRQDRSGLPDNIFTLKDESWQEKVQGCKPSDFWNFKLVEGSKDRFDLRIELSVGFSLSIWDRGFKLLPMAHGTFLSPSDRLPNFRMFKSLVESGAAEFPPVVREIAESDGHIIVTWTDLGLGGIRRISTLFDEFVGNRNAVDRLAREENITPFNPNPYPPSYQRQPGDELFIPEPMQPAVLDTWKEQLKNYALAFAA